MVKYTEILISILLVILLISCTSNGRKFVSKNYYNPKPDRESREIYISDHPELNSRIRGLIRNGLVDVGMSKDEVSASWGKPDAINKESKFGSDEVWFYWDNPKFHRYVYFRKEIVIKVK